jgi:hypothetical protein
VIIPTVAPLNSPLPKIHGLPESQMNSLIADPANRMDPNTVDIEEVS